MLRSRWPVIHLPQVLLLQLFQSDQVVLAFLMCELREAHRTKQGVFFAGGTQADDFYLLLFMLFVHAGNLGLKVELGLHAFRFHAILKI